MAKLLYVDVETTGLDAEKCEIVQFAAIVEINGREMERFCINIKPSDNCVWEPAAAEKNKLSPDIMNQYTPKDEAFNLIKSYLKKYVDTTRRDDKFFLVGYNVKFDEAFIRKFFNMVSGYEFTYSNFFWFPSLDIAQIIAIKTLDSRSVFPNFKLATLCRVLQVDFKDDNFHNAMYDIEKSRELFLKVLKK